MKAFILVTSILLVGWNLSFATVSYLAVNHVTKQLYIYDEGQCKGIFWKGIAGEEYIWRAKEAHYLEKGYTYTKQPYTLNYILYSLIFLLIVSIFFISRRRNLIRSK